MKDSGIEWVGEIPNHWVVMPNKYLMRKQKVVYPIYKGQAILSLTMKGVIERDLDAGGKMPSSFDGYQYVKSGNLLLCLFDIDVTPRCAGLILQDGVTSPAYSQYIMRQKAYAPFYSYYYVMVDNTKELLHMAKNLRHSLNEEQFGAIKAPVPPLSEQKAIAEFLDKKCGEVDALIADIQQEIETLEQYKRSVITEAVTKGLDPSVPMKDSGIDWVGKIPAIWETKRIAAFYQLRNEKVSDKDFPPLSVTKQGVLPQLETVAKTDDGDNRKLVRKGDFAINSRSDRRGSCGISDYDGSVSLINIVLKPRREANNKYYNWLFHTEQFADEFYKWGNGIVDDLWTTRWQNMKKIIIPVPPIEEQQQIADYLDKKCKEIEEIIADKQSQIETLESYKKSLIYEYVTGKKEVG